MDKKFSHYFVDDTTKEHKTYENNFTFNGKNLRYFTQDGVFSKRDIDQGSQFLAECAIKDNVQGRGLDLGCGYGAITLMLALNSNVTMLACDINERAVNLANQNFEINKINAKAIVSNSAKNIAECNFDFVITNPPIRAGNTVLFDFFEDSYAKLRDNGTFYAVLRKKQGAETYSKKIENIYKNIEILDKHKGYIVVKSIKQSR